MSRSPPFSGMWAGAEPADRERGDVLTVYVSDPPPTTPAKAPKVPCYPLMARARVRMRARVCALAHCQLAESGHWRLVR
ncbi:hypothetical protein GCM10010177_75340 [Actinomadura citrea]|nr:hypothetical protein GCM10010177_75340 [Actinomadura citrea]